MLAAEVFGHLPRRKLGLADVAKVAGQVNRLAYFKSNIKKKKKMLHCVRKPNNFDNHFDSLIVRKRSGRM
jgi:hypothetical protein